MIKKTYPQLSFAENFLGGHMTLGKVTIYGENAMHWAANIRLHGGYLCFRLPMRCFGKWFPLYCYLSPDGTPTKATWWGWGKQKVILTNE